MKYFEKFAALPEGRAALFVREFLYDQHQEDFLNTKVYLGELDCHVVPKDELEKIQDILSAVAHEKIKASITTDDPGYWLFEVGKKEAKE